MCGGIHKGVQGCKEMQGGAQRYMKGSTEGYMEVCRGCTAECTGSAERCME